MGHRAMILTTTHHPRHHVVVKDWTRTELERWLEKAAQTDLVLITRAARADRLRRDARRPLLNSRLAAAYVSTDSDKREEQVITSFPPPEARRLSPGDRCSSTRTRSRPSPSSYLHSVLGDSGVSSPARFFRRSCAGHQRPRVLRMPTSTAYSVTAVLGGALGSFFRMVRRTGTRAALLRRRRRPRRPRPAVYAPAPSIQILVEAEVCRGWADA